MYQSNSNYQQARWQGDTLSSQPIIYGQEAPKPNTPETINLKLNSDFKDKRRNFDELDPLNPK